MENCTASGGGYTLHHVLFAATIAVIGTCAAIAAYNYYIDYQLLIKEEDGKDGGRKGRGLLRKQHGVRDSLTKQQGSLKLASSSLASSLAHIEGMEASGKFLSAILSQMWDQMNLAISKTIKEMLEPTLKQLAVPLHFVEIDLGDVPIETHNMFIHRVDLEHGIAGKKTTKRGIQINMDVVWDGNCDIKLQATLSRSAKFTLGVKKIKLSRRLHILLSPLTNELPIISAMQYGFINPPDLELSFSGAIGALEKVGAVRSALPGIVKSAIADLMVLPQRLNMPMDLGTYDFLDTYEAPVGMVRITVVDGRGFTVKKKALLMDIPDVYVKISVGASKPSRTSVQYDSLTPSWKNETHDFILYDMDQRVYLNVFDKDTNASNSDEKLGKAHVRVRDIFRNNGRVELELEKNGKKNGCVITIDVELFHLSEQLHSFTSTKYKEKAHLCGLLTVIVTKAFNIPLPKEDAATFVKVTYGKASSNGATFCTGAVMDYPGYDALNPMYDVAFHIPLTAAMMKADPSKKGKNDLTFTLIDTKGSNGTKGHGELGKILIAHESLLEAYKNTLIETSPIGKKGAKLEYMISLSGMQTGKEFEAHIAGGNEAPEGVSSEGDRSTEGQAVSKPPRSLYGGMETCVSIRVTAVCGRGFKFRKRKLQKDDVPDVYCNICLGYDKLWRTATIKDDTMPQWNEFRDFASVVPSETTVRVDAYEDNKFKDDYLGSATFSVEELLRKRVMEAELRHGSELTGSHVQFRCIELETD